MGYEKRNITRQKLRQKYRELGVCVQCGKPVVGDKNECQHHLDQHRDCRWRARIRQTPEQIAKERLRSKRNRQNRRESGRCTNCGMVYERETWACEDNDETETYRIHLRKVKSSRSWAKNIQSEKPVPSQRLRCSPGADYA